MNLGENVTIVLKNGDSYEAPIANLESIKRLVDYKDIIYPGFEFEESEPGDGEKRKAGRPKSKTN